MVIARRTDRKRPGSAERARRGMAESAEWTGDGRVQAGRPAGAAGAWWKVPNGAETTGIGQEGPTGAAGAMVESAEWAGGAPKDVKTTRTPVCETVQKRSKTCVHSCCVAFGPPSTAAKFRCPCHKPSQAGGGKWGKVWQNSANRGGAIVLEVLATRHGALGAGASQHARKLLPKMIEILTSGLGSAAINNRGASPMHTRLTFCFPAWSAAFSLHFAPARIPFGRHVALFTP